MGKIKSALGAAAMALAVAAITAVPSMAAEKGELVVAQPVLRQQFDPTSLVATTDFLAQSMLFDGLLDLTEKGLVPALAESWTVSADGKQIDFKLRPGVRFQNGEPLTANDVAFTIARVMAPDSTQSYRQPFQQSISNIVVVDPRTVRFVLKHPWPGYFTASRNALVGIVPKDYYEKVGPKGFQDKPIGTGPFQLVDLKRGEWTKVAANENYWGGAPHVKTVITRLVSEPFTRYAMLDRGEADIAMGITGPLLQKIQQNKNLRIISAKYSGTSALYFNKTTFPQSKDERVRLAIGHAIDLKGIATHILGGICEPASSIFTPATFGYLPGLKVLSYDPAEAKKLVAEAGVKPGTSVTFMIHTQSFGSLPNAPQVLEAIAGNLEAIGFKVVRKAYDTGAFLSGMRGGKQPDIFYGPSSIPDDGSTIMDGWFLPKSVWSSGNVDDPEYLAIYNKQLSESNVDKRRALIQEFARLEAKNHRAIPLFWCDTPFAVGPRVESWHPSLGSGYQLNLNELKLKD
jgi:peptide/nickel transport system substrate-binding protein